MLVGGDLVASGRDLVDEAQDLCLGANLEELGDGFGRSVELALGAVGLVGLVLGEDVAQVVDARLVEGLERLEDVGGLGLPLLRGRLELDRDGVGLLGAGLDALLAQLLRRLLGLLKRLGHAGEVGRHGGHAGDVLSGMVVSQGRLDVALDMFGKLVVREGNLLGRLYQLGPGALEDTASWVSRELGEEAVGGGYAPQFGLRIGHLELCESAQAHDIFFLDATAFLR